MVWPARLALESCRGYLRLTKAADQIKISYFHLLKCTDDDRYALCKLSTAFASAA